jgi:hypothetical protein
VISWLFELDGEASDLLALRQLASAYDCTIRPGPGDELWLGGARFDDIPTSEQALEEAKKALIRLNGLARLENQKHRTVGLGNEFLQDGRMQYDKPPYRSSSSTVSGLHFPASGTGRRAGNRAAS